MEISQMIFMPKASYDTEGEYNVTLIATNDSLF